MKGMERYVQPLSYGRIGMRWRKARRVGELKGVLKVSELNKREKLIEDQKIIVNK